MDITGILLLASQISATIGTLVLAGLTYYSIKNSESQLKYIREQTKILKHDKFPLLKVIKKKYKKNSINLKIKNVGEKSAFKIGVETKFLLAQAHLVEDKKSISFSFDPTKISDIINGNPIIRSNGYIVWNSKRKTIFIPPKELENLSFIPKFAAIYINKNDTLIGRTIGRYFDLDELIKITKSNKKRFIEIEINLIYQDYTGDLKERVPLFRYVFDIEKDKTLEDCFKRKWVGSLTPVGANESETRLDGMFSFLYEGISDPKKDIK